MNLLSQSNYVPMMENPEASTDDAGDTETTEAEAE